MEIRNSLVKSKKLHKEIESIYKYIDGIITFDMTLFSSTFYQNVDGLKDDMMKMLYLYIYYCVFELEILCQTVKIIRVFLVEH